MNTAKHALTFFLSAMLTLSAWAVPAYRGWQERTLADGTPITIRQIGDEFYHFWETEDGKIALEQEDGTFVLSEEGRPTGEQIASRRKMARMYPSKSRKAIGDLNLAPRGLVILVQFSDVMFNTANDRQAHDDMLNKIGYNYNGATGSAVEYFKAQSNNTYAPVFDVIGPVTLDNNLAYYGAQGTIAGYSQNDMYIADFVIDAVTKAEAAGCDFSKYDGDNDGYVDIVYFIYAGKGQADGGGTNTIWPHNWELESALYFKQTHGTSPYYYNDTYPYSHNTPRFDGKYINNYACSGELNGSNERSGIGTLCHEFSHVLGLPDYYVTDEDASNEGKNYTPGAWSIMDYGSYNNKGKTPPNYSAFDKYNMGWATPGFLKKDEKKNVTLTTNYGDAYQIDGTTSGPKAYTNTSTIWYLENRQKTGWDRYLPGHGMCVWEVKFNETDWTNNEPNNERVGYTLVTANSLSKPYTPCVYSTTASSMSGTTFPGTSNKTSYAPVTGCALTEITESGGNITFKYNGGIDCHNVITNGTGCTITPSVSCIENSNTLTATITPTDATYDFTSLTVTRGSTTLTSGTHYTLSSDKKTLTINASAISGTASNDITITAVWTKNRYSYGMLGENCTAELNGTVNKNASLNLTITPDAGYTLANAACWDVTMGGNTLTYGSDFTYSGTTFSITSVTGDVEILAYGLHPVTWMANGSAHAANVAVDGKITLPADPEDCSESKKFVGWCTTSDYSHATTAPTFAKTGDTYSVATYYAVYATPAPSSAPKRAKKAIATYNKVSSGTITDGQYLIVYEDGSVAFDGSLTTLDAANNTIDVTVSEGVITGDHESSEFTIGATDGTIQSASGKYIGNGSNSNGLTSSDSELTNTLSIDGSGNFVVESSGGAFLRYNNASNQARFRYFKSSTYTAQQAIQLYKKAGSGGGGGSYTDYTTVCETCTLSSIALNTTGVKTTFVTNETFTSEGLVVTANYSNCSSKAVIPNSVSAPDMSSAGDKTVTVSYTEGGETKTNTYPITVVAPKTVTYMACGDVFTTQEYAPGATLVLPTETPGANDGMTFAGWITSPSYTNKTTAPTYVTSGDAVNADVTYYAVFH